jgi:hypothetical protein
MYVSFTLIVVAGIAGACYMALHDHPFLAAAILLMVGSVSYGNDTSDDEE